MTIPAHIPFTVAVYIDTWNLAASLSTAAMTLPAHSLGSRLEGSDQPRIGRVAIGNLMTLTTGNINMMRHLLLASYAAMAGRTVFGSIRQFRIV